MTHPVKTIGVVGAGTMGAGIAQVAAQSGYDVVLIDANDEFIQRGLDRITADLNRGIERQKVSEEERDKALGRIQAGTDYAALSACQLVIEAVPETFTIKEPVLLGIAKSIGDRCIVASNTSSLSITDLSTFIPEPSRMVGMHFFNPVQRMALVEVVAGAQTSDEVIDIVTQVAESMGKTTVQSADKPGFIVNRILIPMINEAFQTLQNEVASAEDIDTAMKLGAAHPMGPLSLADLIGIDVVLDIMRVLEKAFGPNYAPADLLVDYVASGRLGRKSGRGVFTYDGSPA